MVSVLEELTDIHQVAKLCGVSIQPLHNYTRSLEIASSKIGHFRKQDPDVLAREIHTRGRPSAKVST